MLRVLIWPLSTIFLLDLGTSPTVWYFCFSFHYADNSGLRHNGCH